MALPASESDISDQVSFMVLMLGKLSNENLREREDSAGLNKCRGGRRPIRTGELVMKRSPPRFASLIASA
jgi:hypothetical protein